MKKFYLEESIVKETRNRKFEISFLKLIIFLLLSYSNVKGENNTLSFNEVVPTQNMNMPDDALQVSGTVKDERGEPMLGVSVLIKGTTVGTITNLDGIYSLKLSNKEQVLVFSYVGYLPIEKSVKAGEKVLIYLQPNVKELEQVVVIGYGVQKKSNVTGSIASIKGDELSNLANTNAASALQGKVSGVQVVNSSGAPGASASIRIRGYSSNGNSDPLYIVDGLKVQNIDFIEPENIKSIEILKDGASAAIYGAEAGNGVVLITTKTGAKNAGKIFLNTQNSYSSIASKIKLLNSQDYSAFLLEAYPDRKEELDYFYTNDPSSMIKGKLANTDWQDEFFAQGRKQRYNIGFQGGNNDGSYYVSLGYLTDDGIVTGNKDSYNKFSAQINANHMIKKWLEVGTTTSFEDLKVNKVSESSGLYGATLSSLRAIDPLTPVEYENGYEGTSPLLKIALEQGFNPLINAETNNYYGVSYWNMGMSNPIAALSRDNEYAKRFSVNGTFYANFKPFKDFVFTSRFGYRFSNTYYYRYMPPNWMSPTTTSSSPYLEGFEKGSKYYQWENFANYNFSINNNNFSALAGMSFIQNEVNSVQATTNELESTLSNYLYLNYSTATANDIISGNTLKNAQIAYYGRLSWDYAEKYNLQMNFRADAYDAAYLDLDNSWGYFPSISGGWTISKEDFMSDVDPDLVSFARLRASYGKNGSISNLAPYMYSASLQAGATGLQDAISYKYYMNDKLYTAIYPNAYLANSTLRWEQSVQQNLGLELRLLRDKLSFSADFYNKNTDGLLVRSASNLTTGTSYVWRNVGLVNNHGFEFELNWKGQVTDDFKYSIKGNLSTVSNIVTSYLGKGVRLQGTGISAFEEGYPVWYLRAYKIEGINPETGRAIYKDVYPDGQITELDKEYAGSGIPDFTYGLTLDLNYKNFSFNIYGAGANGQELYYAQMSSKSKNRLQPFFDGRWTSSNSNANYPSALYQSEDPLYDNSDAWIFDGSFFKIKQMQLSYSFSKDLIKHFNMSELKTYISVDNAFTFTKYPGLDPESNPMGDPSGMAIDAGGYPTPRSITIGLNLAF